jgi:SAM-dependent methyltransferase
MTRLGERSRAAERMDAGDVDLATFAACLQDLERINRWTGAYRITLRWLDRVQEVHRARRLVVLDAGSGYGDMLRRIGAWGEARGLGVDLIGVDRNPHAATAAAQATTRAPAVRYLTADVFDVPASVRPDVVISALFAHHLDDRQLVRFLLWMEERARLGWLINDLHRHAVPYWIARSLPVLLRMNRLVRHDAAVSVARAFARRDWEMLLEEAGLAAPPTAVSWCFPFRYAVGRIKRG